ncbi:unnamed protein product [Blepharisma stoltei]|uniref:Uncharacterized protein n=1 Tax=Blepharisma stoltei TaxID=1481888 RepID=A0AAU9KBF9_9CILI|nr:unnamed protein product [Blepharisma stoltei]
MGCASSRSPFDNKTMQKLINEYIEETKLDQVTCNFIKRLDIQCRGDLIDRSSYEMLAKNWHLKANFSLFTKTNFISKSDLKLSLLVFSKDSDESKVALLKEIASTNNRLAMRYPELAYQLVYQRIPEELARMKKISEAEKVAYINKKRLSAGTSACLFFSNYMENPENLKTINIDIN